MAMPDADDAATGVARASGLCRHRQDAGATDAGTGDRSDRDLVLEFLGGHAHALERLMDRYDGLVRYTVHRYSRAQCRSDPQWLDSVASETWVGFVASLRRLGDHLPVSLRGYLVQTARNKTISAVRAASRKSIPISDGAEADPAAPGPGPDEVVARFEQAQALRDCIERLSDSDKEICAHLEAITERRWRDAAVALGLPESTLRSRWKKILEQLRHCMGQKTDDVSRPTTTAATN